VIAHLGFQILDFRLMIAIEHLFTDHRPHRRYLQYEITNLKSLFFAPYTTISPKRLLGKLAVVTTGT
jgi:hypothetical protein